jgi:hypothetical protein
MEFDINGFIQQYLNVEVASSYLDGIKQTVQAAESAWGPSLREEFKNLLTERTMTRGQYCDLTFVEFETDGDMYEYLQKVYDFFFLGRIEAPLIPD